jgi:hypothetical protein
MKSFFNMQNMNLSGSISLPSLQVEESITIDPNAASTLSQRVLLLRTAINDFLTESLKNSAGAEAAAENDENDFPEGDDDDDDE